MDLFNTLRKRACPVCDSTDDSRVVFQDNINEAMLNKFTFASRKTPEFMNFKLVCCPTCDLLYAPSIPKREFLCAAYQHTGYDSNEEAHFAAKSYAKWLYKILLDLPDRSSALEVGTGNGAFLQHLLAAGYQEVIGIEPSTDAVSLAPEQIKNHIRTGMFNANDFSSNYFSLIAIFQTLEHIDQPAQFFSDAFRLLKQNGVAMMVTHNYRYWLMRLLGQKSPIVDIEHLQLFSPKSLRFVLKKAGFRKIQTYSLRNTYPLHYWIKLLPIPAYLKNAMLIFLQQGSGRRIGAINISMKVGNAITWAYK